VAVDTISPTPIPDTDSSLIIPFNEPFTFDSNSILIQFPKYCLYEDLTFKHSLGDTIKHAVTPIHNIQNLYTPLQKKMTVSIRVPNVAPEIGGKYIAVSLNEKHKMIAPEGGTYKDGWLTFKTRSFGPYTVMIDTTPPVIKPINFLAISNVITDVPELILQVDDNLSGVKYYDAYIDGEWHLLQYDYKTGLIWLRFTEKAPSKGEHILEIKIGDAVNNFKTFTFNFIW
jgi:hypothetical protein